MITMKQGMRYVVTKASDDGTFELGDHISINEDGSINNREAQGWIEERDVAVAILGMDVQVDTSWVDRRKEILRKQLDSLEVCK